jgi:predicted HTH domain antitoxin|tara:strand:+ start:177 stop:368 length:192 start_codon:yes stop_codon:yes gene_type:complete
MANNNWIAWNYKTKTSEIFEYVIDEVNDMLKDNNIKIDYDYDDENDRGYDYYVKLKKDKINDR